jgi:hypothetical protein
MGERTPTSEVHAHATSYPHEQLAPTVPRGYSLVRLVSPAFDGLCRLTHIDGMDSFPLHFCTHRVTIRVISYACVYSRLLTIRIYLSIHLLIIKLVMHTLATVMICLAVQNLLCLPCTRIGATEKGKALWNCFGPHSSLPRAFGLNSKTLMPTSDESNNIPPPPQVVTMIP